MDKKIMKTFLFISSLLFITSFSSQKKTRVVFFGDSITELGARPGGYISRIDSLCKAGKKGDRYEFVGAGVGGNKVYDLYLRMEKDVLDKKPGVVVVYIGVNDVWHKTLTGTGTDPDRFERFYQAILNKLKERNIRAIICTPAVIGEKKDGDNAQDADLNKYSNIVRSLADKNNVKLVDLRKKFMDYYTTNNPQNAEKNVLTYDRVHMNDKGNEVIAEMMWPVIQSLSHMP
jgi:lysophospholipase L1-like esterase